MLNILKKGLRKKPEGDGTEEGGSARNSKIVALGEGSHKILRNDSNAENKTQEIQGC